MGKKFKAPSLNEVEGAFLLGSRETRKQMRANPTPFHQKCPPGYGVCEEGSRVYAVPDAAWCIGCDGDGCKRCRDTGLEMCAR